MTPLVPEAADLGTAVDVHAGFPNAANDSGQGALSLDRLLITSPSSTYLFRIRGESWETEGIFDEDIAVVDRATPVRQGCIVAGWDESGQLHIIKWGPHIRQNVWGVVTATIHQWKSERH